MERLFGYATRAVFGLAAISLVVLAIAFIAIALVEVGRLALAGEKVTSSMLDAVGLIIIALAVFDVAKFLLEEQVARDDKELRSAEEARRTLTKFLTIIVIAASLEAIVFIFQAGRERTDALLYPTLLLGAVVLLVCGLGVYQRLSREVETGEG